MGMKKKLSITRISHSGNDAEELFRTMAMQTAIIDIYEFFTLHLNLSVSTAAIF